MFNSGHHKQTASLYMDAGKDVLSQCVTSLSQWHKPYKWLRKASQQQCPTLRFGPCDTLDQVLHPLAATRIADPLNRRSAIIFNLYFSQFAVRIMDHSDYHGVACSYWESTFLAVYRRFLENHFCPYEYAVCINYATVACQRLQIV